MSDALHILRKDVRHLWPGILMVLTATALEGWMNIRYAQLQMVLPLIGAVWIVSCTYLVASLILEERLTGHQQYWLTRPICRWRLLLSKILFLVTFLALPELVLQAVALAWNGVSPLRHLGNLLLTSVVFSVAIGLVVAALASVTETLLQFLYALIPLAGVVIVGLIISMRGNWGSLEWIRLSAVAIVALAAVVSVLVVQYSRRDTAKARVVLGIAVLLVAVSPFADFWGTAFALQSVLNRHADPSPIRVSFEAAAQRPKGYGIGTYSPKLTEEGIAIPILVTGIPRGTAILTERIAASIDTPEGKSWQSGWAPTGGLAGLNSLDDGRTARADGPYWEYLTVDAAFYRAVKDTPVDVHTSVALTLLGDARSALAHDSLCSVNPAMRSNWIVSCGWPFNGPARAYIRIGSLQSLIVAAGSYGPYPVGGALWHHEATIFSSPSEPPDAKLETWQAVAHFKRDLDLRGIRLRDYVVPRITDVK